MGVFSKISKKTMEFLGKPMGTPSNPESLEADFDRRMAVIFPTKSPVNSLAGPPEETKIAKEIMPKFSGKFMQKLLESKRNLDGVYSNGYFENHYPEADKNLKEFLHEKTMNSWAKALEKKNDESSEHEEGEDRGLTVVININK